MALGRVVCIYLCCACVFCALESATLCVCAVLCYIRCHARLHLELHGVVELLCIVRGALCMCGYTRCKSMAAVCVEHCLRGWLEHKQQV